jgi:hypothetical protein
MKKLVFSVILFLGFNLLLLAQPKLEIVGGDTYDWGKVKKTDALHAKVVLKNAGTDTLKISNVKPTCGCTTAPLSRNTLLPGDTATLDITLKVGNGGSVSKSIRISSNDSVNQIKTLFLRANIIIDLDVSPVSFFDFSKMKPNFDYTKSVFVTNKTEQDVAFSEFIVTPSDAVISLKKDEAVFSPNQLSSITLKPGEKLEVIAKIRPQKKGYYNMSVKMKTTCPSTSTLTITGYGNVEESPLFNN